MIRSVKGPVRNWTSIPRESGDDPEKVNELVNAHGYSPRERG